MEEKMALLIPTTTYDDFRDVDIIIEAVPEKMELKKRIFAELDGICPEGTIFASNTSALSISAMAAATKRPQKVIGMHFFSPASVMKLVEIIPGLDTSQETVDDVVMFAESLRKIPVVVQECAGFLVNRLLMPYLNESAYALQEGAASATEIDRVVVESGMPMGPFTLCDFMGLDICADVGVILYQEYGDRMKPAEIFEAIVKAGRLGEKSGAGFYGYGDKTDEPVKALIKEIQKKTGIAGTVFNLDRVFLPLINEASMCLQENIATVGDINKAMIAGIGMKRGTEMVGPLQIADDMGLDIVLQKMEEFEKTLGPRFHPAPLLRRKVLAGHLGKKTGKGFSEYTS
jgi:3-hydroxyacyl-CoA dehydrogenase/enoyl-CoA hydratase/3-hydroxybutyryl-CoA epimerase